MTTKKISVEYIQREMRRESKHVTIKKKNQWNTETQRKTARRGETKKQKATKQNKMAIVSPFIPVITLNVNELNVPIKRH